MPRGWSEQGLWPSENKRGQKGAYWSSSKDIKTKNKSVLTCETRFLQHFYTCSSGLLGCTRRYIKSPALFFMLSYVRWLLRQSNKCSSTGWGKYYNRFVALDIRAGEQRVRSWWFTTTLFLDAKNFLEPLRAISTPRIFCLLNIAPVAKWSRCVLDVVINYFSQTRPNRPLTQ